MTLLEIKDLSKNFGGIQAIAGLNLEVREGEILGLIGPNGAGKTTLFNVVTGFYPPTQGQVIFKGEDITGLKPNRIASKGLIRTFQSTTLFKEDTVLENVCLGFHMAVETGFLGQLFKTLKQRREEREIEKKAIEILEFMRLLPFKDEAAKNLPYGYQRALGVSISLAANPELLLLDEPVTGMNVEETAVMMEHIKRVCEERKVTVIVVEHDMSAVMGLSDKILVLNFGRKIAEGTPDEIRENDAVIEAYLGTEEE